MPQFSRTARAMSRARLMFVPAAIVAAVSLAATASASPDAQPKPQLKVEASRSPQGARLTMTGKNWPANARIILTATRAPGANKTQTFGTVSADSTGAFTERATAPCTTTDIDMAREQVTFTAADSATGVKVTQRVEGASWVCQ